MIKRVMTLGLLAVFSFSFSHMTLAKGTTLVDGSGKPVKVSGGCAKVSKSGKNDFFYSACHTIKPRTVK